MLINCYATVFLVIILFVRSIAQLPSVFLQVFLSFMYVFSHSYIFARQTVSFFRFIDIVLWIFLLLSTWNGFDAPVQHYTDWLCSDNNIWCPQYIIILKLFHALMSSLDERGSEWMRMIAFFYYATSPILLPFQFSTSLIKCIHRRRQSMTASLNCWYFYSAFRVHFLICAFFIRLHISLMFVESELNCNSIQL